MNIESTLSIVVGIITIIGMVITSIRYIFVDIFVTITKNEAGYLVLRFTNKRSKQIEIKEVRIDEFYIQGLMDMLNEYSCGKEYKKDLNDNMDNLRKSSFVLTSEKVTDFSLTPNGSVYNYRGLAGATEGYRQWGEYTKDVETYITGTAMPVTIRFNGWHIRKKIKVKYTK